jgi:hypothetical protein
LNKNQKSNSKICIYTLRNKIDEKETNHNNNSNKKYSIKKSNEKSIKTKIKTISE